MVPVEYFVGIDHLVTYVGLTKNRFKSNLFCTLPLAGHICTALCSALWCTSSPRTS
jgi:hypothetical protein